MRPSSLRLACAGAMTLLLSVTDARAQSNDPPPVPPPASAASDMVLVKIDSPEEVVLEVQHDEQWQPVCTSPCNKALSTKENYRINGSGVRASKPFRIQQGTEVKLEVDPTSSAGHAISIVVTLIGGVGVVPAVGVTATLVVFEVLGVIFICPLVSALASTSYVGCLGDVGGVVVPLYAKPYVWIPAVAGLVIAGAGGAGIASSPATGVKQSVTGAPPPPAPSGLPITRAPEWRHLTPRELPFAVTTPLLQLSF